MLAWCIMIGIMVLSYGIDGVRLSPKKLDGIFLIALGAFYLLAIIGIVLSH